MRNFGWFENEIWDASLHLFADRPVLTYDTYIEFLFKKKKEAKRKFDVNTRYPRRARRDFPGTLDESLFIYLEFHKNKYLWNWGNHEALRKIGGFVIIVVIIYILVLYGILDCAAMILYVNLDFYCIVSCLLQPVCIDVFCACIHVLPLCCMPHLLIFLRCSLAFVILPVSILLVFMPLFSEPCLLFYWSSPAEDQRVEIAWRWASIS